MRQKQQVNKPDVFPAVNRLRNDKDIKALFAKGKSVFDLALGIRIKKNQLDVSRFTVVVGTKISKKAVDRNKLKRRIRAAIEKNLPEIAPGWDVLVMVKKECLTQTYAEIEEQVDRVLKKAKLL